MCAPFIPDTPMLYDFERQFEAAKSQAECTKKDDFIDEIKHQKRRMELQDDEFERRSKFLFRLLLFVIFVAPILIILIICFFNK